MNSRTESLLTSSRKNALAKALTNHFDEKLTLEITMQESVVEPEVATPHQEEIREKDERLDAARRSLESDAGVHALKNMFGAEMKPETVEIVEKQTAQDQE